MRSSLIHFVILSCLFLSNALFAGRFYDAQLGRWVEVDPVDEFHSPYVYVGNSPIIAIDPDGLLTFMIVDKDNNVVNME